MKTRQQVSAILLATFSLFLAGCSSPSTGTNTDSDAGVIAPVTTDLAGLYEEKFELRVGQALNINTGDFSGEDYTGEVQDSSVAEFVPAVNEEGGAEYNPAVMALKPGETSVELTGPGLDGDSVTFDLVVVDQD